MHVKQCIAQLKKINSICRKSWYKGFRFHVIQKSKLLLFFLIIGYSQNENVSKKWTFKLKRKRCLFELCVRVCVCVGALVIKHISVSYLLHRHIGPFYTVPKSRASKCRSELLVLVWNHFPMNTWIHFSSPSKAYYSILIHVTPNAMLCFLTNWCTICNTLKSRESFYMDTC